MRKATRRMLTTTAMVAPLTILAATGTAFAAGSGPNTSTNPFVSPVVGGVDVTSILTVGDTPGSATNGYEMVGIPDGLGARPLGNGNVEVLMNHELGATVGAVRAHGQRGGFISRYEMNPTTNEIVTGADAILTTSYYDYSSGGRNTTGTNAVFAAGVPTTKPAFDRFCSSDLAPVSAFYNAGSGLGYNGQIYLTGEEAGDEARLFGLDATEGLGTFRQLERAGLFSWENAIASPKPSDKTIVMGQEDGPNSASEVWLYQGTKTNTGDNFDKAGLTNGLSYVAVVDIAAPATVDTETEFRAAYGKNTPVTIKWVEVPWSQSGTAQNAFARSINALGLDRVEDGQFDPSNPNDFYFLTTTGAGGMWRLRFTDVAQGISAGATLTLVLDGSEVPLNAPGAPSNPDITAPDNMTIDNAGHVLIQEDPGNAAHVARVMAYDIPTGLLATLAEFKGGATATPGTMTYTPNGNALAYPTADEESSGIISFDYAPQPAGTGTFLFDAQIHRPPTGWPTDLVEGGQLMKMSVNWNVIFGPTAVVPEVPVVPMLAFGSILVIGGVVYLQRRRSVLA